jgi:hypothetical protein
MNAFLLIVKHKTPTAGAMFTLGPKGLNYLPNFFSKLAQ